MSASVTSNPLPSSDLGNFSERKGIILVLLAGCLWGLGGVGGQFILQEKNINPEWLIAIRQWLPGLILLTLSYRKIGKSTFEPLKRPRELFRLFIFSVFGMMASQLTFFLTVQYSNAATAAILQYLYPVFIAIYLTIRFRKPPSYHLIFSILLAFLGAFLLVTNGRLDQLSLSPTALILGLISSTTSVVYTLYPIPLLQKYNTSLVAGWGMFFGGIILSFFHPFWQPVGIFDAITWIAIFFVIFVAGMLGFVFYLTGVKLIGGSKGSVLATVEPLASVVFSVILLHVSFTFLDWIGSACILATIFILARKKV